MRHKQHIRRGLHADTVNTDIEQLRKAVATLWEEVEHLAGSVRSTADGITIASGKNVTIAADGKAVLVAASSLTIKAGAASIFLKADGTITIKGGDINIDGSGKVTVKSASDVVIKGSKILQN